MSKQMYQFTITLRDFSPQTMRKILIDPQTNFEKIHGYIQTLFGFEDCHIWVFEQKKQNLEYNSLEIRYDSDGGFGNDFTDESIDPRKITIDEAYQKRGIRKLVYRYDFGADWIFDIDIKILENNDKISLPFVEDVKGYMLIEDMSPYELEELISIYQKKDKKSIGDFFDSREEFEKFMQAIFQKIDPKNFSL